MTWYEASAGGFSQQLARLVLVDSVVGKALREDWSSFVEGREDGCGI